MARVSLSTSSENPAALTRSPQGAAHAIVSLPLASVCPSNFPAESRTVAPAIAAPPLSSTVSVKLAGICASRLVGANAIAASARVPATRLNLNHRIALAFGVGEQAVE